jgi:uncharacterized membrane protein
MTELILKKRINSIDFLRGIIMVIMALDHVRDYMHIHAFDDDPTNLATTTPILFFTRFITHYCAPTFVFLSGTSIFLQAQRKTKKELSIFLLSRGLWLIVFEIVINNLFWSFNPFYNFIALQVIWIFGVSMVLMAGIIFLPMRVILILGLLIVCGHNYFDQFNYTDTKNVPLGLAILHQGGLIQFTTNHFIYFFYPIFPWPAVMMLGYCLGTWYVKDYNATKRRKQLLTLGSFAIIAFAVIRYTNAYGDAALWAVQPRGAIYTFLSFLKVSKYPPSLLYILVTLGPSLIALSLIEPVQNKVADFFIVFGRVPLFYYAMHILVIHFITAILFFATGNDIKNIIDYNTPWLFRPQHWGFSLWVIYLIWLGVIFILYPICKKYGNYKATHNKWWLSYL